MTEELKEEQAEEQEVFLPNISDLGDRVVKELEDEADAPISIALFVANRMTGEVASTTNLTMEEFRSFMRFVWTNLRIGEVTTEKPEKKETLQ